MKIALALTWVIACSVMTPAWAASPCGNLLKFSVPETTVSIEKAELIAAGPFAIGPPGAPLVMVQLPAYCRIEGVIGAHPGADGKAYGIRFAVALPESWNGKLLYQGGGGLNGSVMPPVGASAAGDVPALARGFAVVSSDSGHEGKVFDSSFFADQQAALDFLYQSIGKVMSVARPLIKAHYSRGASRSYFVGCSTGGREGMMAAERYPNDFDGIVAGAPAMRTNYSNLALTWVTTQFNAIAPQDVQGLPQPALALSALDRQLVVDGLLKACDALDGVKDGMVFDVVHCSFDPQVLACHGLKTESCLSNDQVGAIRRAFAGPKSTTGRQVYPGFLYDTGIGASGPGIPGLLSGARIPVGPAPTGTTMDVDAAAETAHDASEMMGDTDAWTNLSTFTAHGGKLIFYHGQSDPWFSALDTVGYYQRLTADNPSTAITDWSRLYLVPGMGHCGGGEAALDHFDMVSALVDWVERGRAPEDVVATGAAFPGRSRPLCSYPKHAHYRGAGDSEVATNFTCVN